MTTITCDICGRETQTNVAVYRRVPHYSEPHWVVLERLCTMCAILCGWSPHRPTNDITPFFSSAAQFSDWLQLSPS